MKMCPRGGGVVESGKAGGNECYLKIRTPFHSVFTCMVLIILASYDAMETNGGPSAKLVKPWYKKEVVIFLSSCHGVTPEPTNVILC